MAILALLRAGSRVFWGVCGYLYGQVGSKDGKEGLGEHRTGTPVLKMCVSLSPAASCAVELAANAPETRRNPPVAPTPPSHSHARTSFITHTCAQHAGWKTSRAQAGSEVGKSRVVKKSTSRHAEAPPCWRRRRTPAAPQGDAESTLARLPLVLRARNKRHSNQRSAVSI